MSEHNVEGPKKQDPQSFRMIRNNDETGISGTGVVLEGIVFSNGKCAVTWLSDAPCVTVWDNFEQFRAKHIDSHPDNNTEIEWM
jgi:hypothetical protein